MRQLLYCNLLFIKRSIKKISFIALLILLPILSFLLKHSIEDSDISIHVGIVVNDNSEMAKTIENNLLHNFKSVQFHKCNSVSDLKRKVANQTYECGYVFEQGFSDKIEKGNLNNIVELYKSPGTMINALSNEYVYSEIFSEYAYQELSNYLEKQKDFKYQESPDFHLKLRENYNNYLSSDDVFEFEFVDFDGNKLDNTNLLKSYLVLSVKGLVALFIMLAAFIGTLNLYHDHQTGIFNTFSKNIRPLAKMSEIFSVCLLTGISGLFSMLICNLTNHFVMEIIKILLYCMISSLYCFILYKIIPTPFVFCSTIPLFVIGSIIFCPIFIDMTEILPVAKYISWLFLPRYYFIL